MTTARLDTLMKDTARRAELVKARETNPRTDATTGLPLTEEARKALVERVDVLKKRKELDATHAAEIAAGTLDVSRARRGYVQLVLDREIHQNETLEQLARVQKDTDRANRIQERTTRLKKLRTSIVEERKNFDAASAREFTDLTLSGRNGRQAELDQLIAQSTAFVQAYDPKNAQNLQLKLPKTDEEYFRRAATNQSAAVAIITEEQKRRKPGQSAGFTEAELKRLEDLQAEAVVLRNYGKVHADRLKGY